MNITANSCLLEQSGAPDLKLPIGSCQNLRSGANECYAHVFFLLIPENRDQNCLNPRLRYRINENVTRFRP